MNILVIGANSAIAKATCRLWATEKASFFLVARQDEELTYLAKDLKIRGAKSVHTFKMDVNEKEKHSEMLREAQKVFTQLDIAFIAHGTLCPQETCEKSTEETLKELFTNAISTILILTYLAIVFEKQKKGTIAVITSVAGERGRASNYIYGTAKGAVSIFLEGLRARLFSSSVHVLDIKPGFVDTPMTAEFKKGFLWSSSENIAKGIFKAIKKKKSTVYLPWFWKWIMIIVKCIPEKIFIKLNI